MSTAVLDASALLALVNREPGGQPVAELLPTAVISAVNWAEVRQKVASVGADARRVAAGLTALGLVVAAFDETDAATTADLYPLTSPAGLSLADRACLALARRHGLPAVTADRSWARLPPDVRVQLLR